MLSIFGSGSDMLVARTFLEISDSFCFSPSSFFLFSAIFAFFASICRFLSATSESTVVSVFASASLNFAFVESFTSFFFGQ